MEAKNWLWTTFWLTSNFSPDIFSTHRIRIVDAWFVMFGVVGFTPIDFPTKLEPWEGGFVDPFLTFIFY